MGGGSSAARGGSGGAGGSPQPQAMRSAAATARPAETQGLWLEAKAGQG